MAWLIGGGKVKGADPVDWGGWKGGGGWTGEPGLEMLRFTCCWREGNENK